MAAGIRLEGGKQIAKNLKAMDEKLRKKAVDPALRAGIKKFVVEAQSRAPVDTGQLRDSIKARKDNKAGTRGSTVYVAGVIRSAFYWQFIEFGTSRMSAKPFLRPAFQSTVDDQVRTTLDTLRKKLKLT